MNWQRLRRRAASRAVVGVVGFALVLTAGFVGLVALAVGSRSGLLGRFPYYVLATAGAFVVALWQLDDRSVDGLPVLIGSSGIAIGSGLLVGLAVEGAIYAVRNSGEILISRLIVYFLAAALICTGLGIWGLRHWREFAGLEPVE